MKDGFSILYPFRSETEYRQLSQTACHDLGLDVICKALTNDNAEQNMIMNTISRMTADPRVSSFRQKVFSDILALPELRTKMTELFEKMEFIRSFGTMHKNYDEELGIWHLYHRLDELKDYINCIEAMRECLSDTRIKSQGLTELREYINELYNEADFAEMKQDISALKVKASEVQSITLGINVNDRFEAVSMGLVSINSKPFKKSGIVSNFADAVSSKDKIQDTTDWNGDMHYHQIDRQQTANVGAFVEKLAGFTAVRNTPFVDGNIRATLVKTTDGDGTANSTFYLESVINKMLSSLVKKLRDTLTKYANVAIVNVSQLIPEFVYYIRFAEYIEKLAQKGAVFCEAQVSEDGGTDMTARGFYNLKLASVIENQSEIVTNNLCFDSEHTIYILTGANRGGKTTVTQAVGQLFVLAQGGIHVPAESFSYRPTDCIFTHFPADEDKTMDLGRLGEECIRFKKLFSESTKDSLVLMNETFSTTSFEEGYYIARDSVRALMEKQVRTIYNTHMHKLASDTNELNLNNKGARTASLIMRSNKGQRSFKVEVASPEGMSYACDIAKKYGVTYEMLTGKSEGEV
ncbi:MAG: DNA mismatch repair protein [Ruminococcus sp.]|nr:DNA mismatch repair protein [Ruminococcus sp.]